MQTQVINEATKKEQSVEDPVDNIPLVSEVEKQPRRRRAHTLTSVAQLLAQKEQKLQQIDELEEVRTQLLAQKEQELQHLRMKQVVIELK